MGDLAIRVENLSKRYRIGQRERYLALRDVLARALTAPFRIFSSNSKPDSRNPRSDYIWALKDVSFEVKQGEVVGIIGRNGAGKTTLLKILARITRPTSGYAEVRGRVGSLLEVGTGFHPELTGRENVYLSGAVLGMTKREIDRKFDEIVDFAGVAEFIDTPLKYYSTGMQMRLAFAVAAHLEPEILLVDEVLAVGDLEFQKKCLGKMEDVSRGGRTVLFVSHQMNQIRRLCERVIWLNGGQIVQEGPTHEVVSAYEAAMTSGEWLRRERPDTPRVKARFLRWEIVEPRGDQPNVLTDLGPVTIRFFVEVNGESREWHHSLLLLNVAGQKVWGVDLTFLPLKLGLNELIYVLPYLPIAPGPYKWLALLWDSCGLVDSWMAVPEFLIAMRPFNDCGRDERSGLLNLPFEFFVKSSVQETQT
jgi:lipopolysaccharide transport system ATP-binding protein